MLGATTYRRDIQVLRGLAVLAVVLFHAFEGIFPLGYLGVDFFFVISGFVVTPLILRIFTQQSTKKWARYSNLIEFYKRRYYRLAPALAATLVFSTVIIFLFDSPNNHMRFARQGIATILLFGNIGAHRYSGDYFDPNPNPLVHTWSLSIEEQMYIFFPLVMVLLIRCRYSFKKTMIATVSFLSILSFMSFLFPVIMDPLYSRIGTNYSNSVFAFYSPIDRLWQFTAGAFGFLLQTRYRSFVERYSYLANFLLAVSVLLVLFGPLHLNLKIGSVLATLIGFTSIAFKSLEVLPEFFIQKLEWLGDRSYSIYLVHMPLLYIAKFSALTSFGNDNNRIIQSSIGVLFAILLGALSFSKIENRFRDKGEKTGGKKRLTITLVLTFVIPLVFLLIMDRGSAKLYWGLDRNIQPPLHSGLLASNCNLNALSGPPCSYKSPGSIGTVLLLGDSHAGHISQAFVRAAKESSWNLAVSSYGSCHVQFKRSRNSQTSDLCLIRNIENLSWASKVKPDVIVVSQYVFSDSSQSDLRDGLLQLKSVTPNVVLIENNPIFPDGKDFMVSRPIFMAPYLPTYEIPKSMMQTKNKHASDALANWARNAGILTISLESLFCNSKTCMRYYNGEWLYYDDNHLSIAGADLTVPLLRSILNRY